MSNNQRKVNTLHIIEGRKKENETYLFKDTRSHPCCNMQASTHPLHTHTHKVGVVGVVSALRLKSLTTANGKIGVIVRDKRTRQLLSTYLYQQLSDANHTSQMQPTHPSPHTPTGTLHFTYFLSLAQQQPLLVE